MEEQSVLQRLGFALELDGQVGVCAVPQKYLENRLYLIVDSWQCK